jgi:hypothetical protein
MLLQEQSDRGMKPESWLVVTSARRFSDGIALINRVPLRSNEAIFLFLIIGGERILCMMTTGVSCARHGLAKSGGIFSTTAMRLASFLASSVWFPFDMVSASLPFNWKPLSAVGAFKLRMAASPLHPLKRKEVSGCCPQFVLDMVSADLVKLQVQCRDSLRFENGTPKVGKMSGTIRDVGCQFAGEPTLDFLPDARGWVCHHEKFPCQLGPRVSCVQVNHSGR